MDAQRTEMMTRDGVRVIRTATPFDPAETSAGPFTTAAGPQVTAQFMNGGEYRSVRAGGWTAVWLP